MGNPALTWWPADNVFQIARDGDALLCRDRSQALVTPVPDTVRDTRHYPAWALVNRPTEVDEAVAADVAMATARGKPHYLAQKFERIASDLPATHLPVFYDRAARQLASHGDHKRAAAMFGKARAAESAADAVPIADETWLALHREFAALGALSTKSTADFVKALKKRAAPEAAVEALTQVAILRARAGQAPWPQLPKQLSSFAKAAGLDEVTVHRELLEELLEAESVWESAAAMWTAWRPILVRVCAESARVRGLLLNLLPEPESLDGWWLELLDECGATAGLVGPAEPEAEPVGGRAAWLERTIWHPNMNRTMRRRSRVSKLLPAQISELIARMAPALRADGVPVHLDGPDYWTQRVDLRVLEACLANGVPVASLKSGSGLGLDLWLRGRRQEDGLTATLADPRFAAVVAVWVQRNDATQLWAIPGMEAFESLRNAASTAAHALDGPRIYSAIHGFGAIGSLSDRAVPRLLYSLRTLTQALRDGTVESIAPEDLRLGESASLAGRVEWMVLRAVAPSTPPDRRELLLAVLEAWAESVLADPAAQFFHGTVVDPDRTFAADEHGVAMTTFHHVAPQPFVALTHGCGEEPPSLGGTGTLTEVPLGWGTADRLRRVVALLHRYGGVPHDPAAAATLAARTGMTGYAAEMALAGLLGAGGYTMPFMAAEERKVLGIGAKQAEAGQEELAFVRHEQRMALLLGVLPDDPAELWQPGGTLALAERLAANWIAQYGRSAAVPRPGA